MKISQLLGITWVLFSIWLVWDISKTDVGYAIITGFICLVMFTWLIKSKNNKKLNKHQDMKTSCRNQNELLNK